jgi:hypothetical protein
MQIVAYFMFLGMNCTVPEPLFVGFIGLKRKVSIFNKGFATSNTLFGTFFIKPNWVYKSILQRLVAFYFFGLK